MEGEIAGGMGAWWEGRKGEVEQSRKNGGIDDAGAPSDEVGGKPIQW